ncbi:MAG: DUF971 domain-containing protein [Acidobacteriota bacterium]
MRYTKSGTTLVELRRLPAERAVRLTWDDGAVATFTWRLLQGYCPCALCRGHEGADIEFVEPRREIRGLEAAPVGNYAVNLALDGGCNTGIFPFDFLREIARREDLLKAVQS